MVRAIVTISRQGSATAVALGRLELVEVSGLPTRPPEIGHPACRIDRTLADHVVRNRSAGVARRPANVECRHQPLNEHSSHLCRRAATTALGLR